MILFSETCLKIFLVFTLLTFILPLPLCSNNNTENKTDEVKVDLKPQSKAVKSEDSPRTTVNIESEDHFKAVIDSSGDRLLIFDLYADWCMPCRILSPMLEEIAKEYGDKASFYKIDIDKHRGIASVFGPKGIPYVVFVKNKKGVHALMGVQPKDVYIRAITELTKK